MTRVLVTGYGGFLGQAVVRQLLSAGYTVRGLARGRYPDLASLGVEAMEGNITDRDTVLAACRDCQAIIHTAAKAGVWGSWRDYHAANVRATSHLLEAAQRQRVQAFVYTSSPSVTFAGEHQSGVDERLGYPRRWLCYYPQTKAMAEQAVLNASTTAGLATCALRPHLIWGAGDPHLFPRVVERAKSGRLVRIGSGENLIDVVHVDGAARAHLLAMIRLLDGDQALSGQAMFLTDGQPLGCWAWISRILALADLPIPRRSLSFPVAYRIGWALERVYAALRIQSEPPLTRFVASQLAMDHYFDITRARRLLDYAPAADLDEQFAHCRTWLQDLASRP